MKIPRKHEVTIGSGQLNNLNVPYAEAWTYNHENRLFGEIAGHVINKYLNVRQEKARLTMGTRFRFRFSSSNPNKAGLWLEHMVSDLDLVQSNSSERTLEVVYENAVDELINKALNAVDVVHNLKKSFWTRLKFLFNPTF